MVGKNSEVCGGERGERVVGSMGSVQGRSHGVGKQMQWNEESAVAHAWFAQWLAEADPGVLLVIEGSDEEWEFLGKHMEGRRSGGSRAT